MTSLSQLTEAQRFAAIANALDETVQNARAEEIRRELIESVDLAQLDPETWRQVLAAQFNDAVGEHKRPPLSFKE